VTQISEVVKAKEYSIQDIFVFDEGSAVLKPVNIKPNFADKLRKAAGYTLPGS